MPDVTPSTTVRSPLRLYGRSGELALLERLLTRLRAGRGGTLVLTGAPGLGRTALLRHAIDDTSASGPVLLHATAAPAEHLVPYSGLHTLLSLIHI